VEMSFKGWFTGPDLFREGAAQGTTGAAGRFFRGGGTSWHLMNGHVAER